MIDIDPSRADAQQIPDKPLNLSDFAQRNQITEDRVWELIEEGELAARFVNDEILILREQEVVPPESVPAEPVVDLQETVAAPAAVIEEEADFLPFDEIPPPTDDHRELLMFAQDAMNRTMDLSRQLLATKDELIRMKDERIAHLLRDHQSQEQEIRRLKKKVEDLETLCRLNPTP